MEQRSSSLVTFSVRLSYILLKPNCLVMKYIILIFLALFAILSHAQVAVLDYMKVTPENELEYLEVEEIWKKVHEEKVRVGLTKGWYLYKVRFTGTSSPYQYVTINISVVIKGI